MVNRKIWKYAIGMGAEIELPTNSVVLSCQLQNDEICLWVSVIPDNPLMWHKFVVIPTGVEHDPTGLRFYGTVQQTIKSDIFVWHVFEKIHS